MERVQGTSLEETRWLQVHTRTSQTASRLWLPGPRPDEPDSAAAVVTWAPARGWISGDKARTQVYGPPARAQLPARPSALGAPGSLQQGRGTPAFIRRDFLQGGRVPLGRCGDTWAWVPSLRFLSQTTNPGVSWWKSPFLKAVLGALRCYFGQRVSALSLYQLAEGTFSQKQTLTPKTIYHTENSGSVVTSPEVQ